MIEVKLHNPKRPPNGKQAVREEISRVWFRHRFKPRGPNLHTFLNESLLQPGSEPKEWHTKPAEYTTFYRVRNLQGLLPIENISQ
jgi:hypothetical protein